MIIGIGTDIVELARLKTAIARNGEAFLRRVYTTAELDAAKTRLEYLAGRWAVKEAAAKALGCGIGSGCAFTDIEVSNAPSGAPAVTCKASAAKRMEEVYRDLRWHVSISHERTYAVATVIIEGEKR